VAKVLGALSAGKAENHKEAVENGKQAANMCDKVKQKFKATQTY